MTENILGRGTENLLERINVKYNWEAFGKSGWEE